MKVEFHVEDLATIVPPPLPPDASRTWTKAELQIDRLCELGAEGWNLVNVDRGMAYLWRPMGQYSTDWRAHRRLIDGRLDSSRAG